MWPKTCHAPTCWLYFVIEKSTCWLYLEKQVLSDKWLAMAYLHQLSQAPWFSSWSLQPYSISSILLSSSMANGVAPMCHPAENVLGIFLFFFWNGKRVRYLSKPSMGRPTSCNPNRGKQRVTYFFLPYSNNAKSTSLWWRTSLHKFQSLRMHYVIVYICMCEQDGGRWDSRSFPNLRTFPSSNLSCMFFFFFFDQFLCMFKDLNYGGNIW